MRILDSDINPANLPQLTPKDERSVQKHIEIHLNDMVSDYNAKALQMGESPMSEEEREDLRNILEEATRLAKQLAKQKYTPKKYRK